MPGEQRNHDFSGAHKFKICDGAIMMRFDRVVLICNDRVMPRLSKRDVDAVRFATPNGVFPGIRQQCLKLLTGKSVD